MKIQYVLPVKGGSGGAHSVAQEVNELIKFGVDARIAVDRKNAPAFLTAYSDMPRVVDVIDPYETPGDLANLIKVRELVVCTIFTSVKIVREALASLHGDRPAVAYYIQDYEPLFLHVDDPKRSEALESYTIFKDALLFAKTNWIRDMVTINHNVSVAKVSPSLDSEIYYPKARTHQGPMMVTAMVRPHTSRRAPRRTMNVLKDLNNAFGDRVIINIFGCSDDDLVVNQFPIDFTFTNHGVLKREQVGTLFRNTDLFMDLSDYQAFGRTGLEAMACGASTILPIFGGAEEYALHDVNALLVDTRSRNEILSAAEKIMTMTGARLNELRRQAILTSQAFSVSKAAYSKYTLFQGHLSDRMA